MTRVERMGSLSYNRVRGSYINRQRTSDTVTRTEPVEPVLHTQNQTAFSSENHLIAYDNYYRQLRKMETEFEKYLGNPEYVLEQLEKEKEQEPREGFQGRKSELYGRIRSLISKFNATVEALVYIDKNYQTENVKSLHVILANHEERLARLGIMTRNLYLEIDGGIFWKRYLESENPYEELFRPLSRLLLTLYMKFRNIMVHKKNKYNAFSEDYKGTIINQAF